MLYQGLLLVYCRRNRWLEYNFVTRLEVVLSCLSLGEVLWIESFIRIKEEVTCVLVLKGFLALWLWRLSLLSCDRKTLRRILCLIVKKFLLYSKKALIAELARMAISILGVGANGG